MNRGTLLIFAGVLCLSPGISSQSWGRDANKDRVLLSEIQTLTLYKDKMTTARRTRPIPQLSCIGGSAGCTVFTPQVVQCYNRGSDGMDTQWECKTDMSMDFRFGQIEVVCEGYDSPDDPTILKGSCGLEYSLELTDEGKTHRTGYSSNDYRKSTTVTSTPWYINWIFLGAVGFFVYYLYKTCIRQNQYSPTNSDSPSAGPGTGGTGRGTGYPGAPPPYPGHDTGAFPGSADSCGAPPQAAPRAGGWAPGFWSGIGAGSALGWLFGRRTHNAGYGAGNMGYGGGGSMFGGGGYSRGPSYSPSYGGGGGSSGFSSGGGSREASGFGGTRRR